MSERFHGTEYLDDLVLDDRSLRQALIELVMVNRFLGGYQATRSALGAYLRARAPGPVHVLDLGSGLADGPADLVRWGHRQGIEIQVMALEGNAAICQFAEDWLDQHLEADLRGRVQVVQQDVWKLDASPKSHDIVIASLFLHHMTNDQAVDLLRLMQSLARGGILINDLHRNAFAYHAIGLLARAFRTSDIFRHDGPLSVRRGFTREELHALAHRAGLENVAVHWQWAFRWTLSTLVSRV